MKAEVKRDRSVRTVEITVTDGPVVDVTESWHKKAGRSIQVDHVRVTAEDGEVRSLVASGQLRRKDGTPSPHHTQRESKTWLAHHEATWKPSIETAPEWARLMWAEATTGVTTWSSVAPEEVQEL